jgi:virulence factor Mce-like protein
MNRRRSSLAASPLLIGAITTLIVIVAVFLSYNANNGLPFVPTYDIKVELPEASGLQQSNQVRIAGTRVGIVSALSPHQNPRTGRVTAIATLHLEKKFESLPADTKAIVQSVSAVGLKYLELEKGSSRTKLKPGQTIPLAQTREPVDIEEFFNMFNKPTRTAIKVNTNNFGDGLAGRGLGINNAIHELRPLVAKAIPVLHNLAAPQTGLHDLFVDLDRVASQTAPVAQTNAELFEDLDTFFAAWGGVARSIEAATKEGPPSLEQATYSLPHEKPFYENLKEFVRLLRPSAADLTTVAPQLGHAFKVGAVNLTAATALSTNLAESAQALEEFGRNPVVSLALENFAETLEIGNPLLAGIAPEQVNCNYWTLAFRNFASLDAENIGVGTVARGSALLSPTGASNEGFPAGTIANGPDIEHPAKGSALIVPNNHLHYNPYPAVTGPGQADICEAANEEYEAGKALIGKAVRSTDNREFTSREENLYGEKYPAPVLAALGLNKPAPAAKAKPKSKAKSKSKPPATTSSVETKGSGR